MTATVISPDGNPVKLRPTPSTEKPWLEKIPVHTVVTLLEQGSPWSKIAFRDLTGYMKSEFLQTADPDAVPESDPASVSSGVDYETAFHQLAALAAQMMDIIEQNGVG